KEVEVGPQLLELDRDVLVEESEKCTVVGCRGASTTSSPDEERRRYAVPTDDVVEVRHIGALLHRAICGGHECFAQGLLTLDVDAAFQHSQLDDVHVTAWCGSANPVSDPGALAGRAGGPLQRQLPSQP